MQGRGGGGGEEEGVLEVSRLLWGTACSHRSINVEVIAVKAIDLWSSERGNNFHLYEAL